MTFKQNLTELKSYINQAPVEHRAKIQDVIKLYQENVNSPLKNIKD